MTVSSGAETVFGWLVNLTTVGGFIAWWVMNCTYLSLRKYSSFASEVAATHTDRLRVQETGIRKEEAHLPQPHSGFSHISRGGVFSGQHSFSSSLASRHGSSGIHSDINIPIFFIPDFGYKIIRSVGGARWTLLLVSPSFSDKITLLGDG